MLSAQAPRSERPEMISSERREGERGGGVVLPSSPGKQVLRRFGERPNEAWPAGLEKQDEFRLPSRTGVVSRIRMKKRVWTRTPAIKAALCFPSASTQRQIEGDFGQFF